MKAANSRRHCCARTAPLFLFSILLTVSCGGDGPPTESLADRGQEHAQIAWFEGDVEGAFALARSEGKPLFLYWGAEWCPPCHYLKKKIFVRPEFVARMRNFVPVYLDGDTARAQILGEKLQVMGYPTVIIFDPTGREVMRMPSTVPVEQYETVLDSAIASMRPVKEILSDVLASGPASASPSDLNLLAFYSWGQDSQVELPLAERVAAFERLYSEIPDELAIERSRFLGLYLMSLAEQKRRDESPASALAPEQRSALQTEIETVLADARQRNVNLLWILYYAEDIVNLLHPEDTAARSLLLTTWAEAADLLERDASLSVDDRLNATRLELEMARLRTTDPETYSVSVELQQHARAQAAWAMETVKDESELQSVVNTLAYLLEDADLGAEAEAMLLAKMNDTVAPYYFMSWIAGMREDAGDHEAALEWHRRAYDSAQGRYSRFRWGSTYLRRLMTLAPENAERIEADSLEVLTELLTHEDAFAGGNHSRLSALERGYASWNGDGRHDDVLTRLRDFVHAACDRYSATGVDSQQLRCRSFLVPADEGSEAAL